MIMRQFNREELKAEGFVPQNWDYEAGVDPMKLIRQASKYCAEDHDRRQNVLNLLDNELTLLKKRNLERYEEIKSFHEKELSIVMSNEGELLAKLRLLMVLRGFNLEWLKENGIVTDKLIAASTKLDKRAKFKAAKQRIADNQKSSNQKTKCKSIKNRKTKQS